MKLSLLIGINGLLLFHFSVAQNVGIGTQTPQSPLHIKATTGEALRLQSSDPFIGFFDNTGSYGAYVWLNKLFGNDLRIGTPQGSNIAIAFAPNNNASLYIAANGNAGVGTSNPTEKLEVNGAIKANSYKFSTPKTYYYSIPPTAFGAASGSQPAESRSTGAYCSANPTPLGRITAPVYLPQGALITEFKVYYYDNSTVSDVRSLLFGNPLGTDGLFTMATVTSSGAAGLGNGAQAGLGWQINNQTNAYSIECFSTNNEWPGAGLQIRSIVITYTLPEVN